MQEIYNCSTKTSLMVYIVLQPVHKDAKCLTYFMSDTEHFLLWVSVNTLGYSCNV